MYPQKREEAEGSGARAFTPNPGVMSMQGGLNGSGSWRGEPGEFLSVAVTAAAGARRDGSVRCNPADCALASAPLDIGGSRRSCTAGSDREP